MERKTFEVVDDRIESNNRSQDSELYKAYVKLEDILEGNIEKLSKRVITAI